jgi:hypothetical protein
LAIPNAVVLVAIDGIIPIEFVSIDFKDRACCIRTTFENGSVGINDDNDNRTIGKENYSIQPITPNPYTEKELEINYSIGLDAVTTINIYNSKGDIVKVVIDSYQIADVYKVHVNIADLTSGAYTITIRSGTYKDTQKFIIVR